MTPSQRTPEERRPIGALLAPDILEVLEENPSQIAAETGHPTYQAYGALVHETPTPQDAPATLDPERADGGEGINADIGTWDK